MKRGFALFVAALAASMPLAPARAATGDTCGWTAPTTVRTKTVTTTAQLLDAVATARPHTTILVAAGEYFLDRTLEVLTPHIVVRGSGGDRAKVVIRGMGISENRVGVAIGIGAPDVTIADLTVGYVRYHGIQIRGERGASRATIHNIRVVDTGQQLLKGSTAGGPLYADDCLVACSLFEYTTTAPSNYTNGVDVLAGKNWTVRDNQFRRIRGPASQKSQSGPAVLFWANSSGTVVERNVVVESYRGIAFGLGPGASTLARDSEKLVDHAGGRIRQNVVVNLEPWADEGIEVSSAADVIIERNTVLVEGQLGWSISARFPATSASIRNNLTNRRVILRNGGRATEQDNIEIADGSWFVDVSRLNLRLKPERLAAYGHVGAFADEGRER